MKKLTILSIALLANICSHAQTWDIGYPNITDVKATLSGDTLYIRGTGEMKSYTPNYPTYSTAAPWYLTHKTLIKHVVVEDGVTSIGSYAFQSCSNLISASLPDNITTLGRYAFTGTALVSIKIPTNVTKIPDFCFSSCNSLESITIHENITSIGSQAFRSCLKLSSVVIHRHIPPIIVNKSNYLVSNPFDNTPINSATLTVPCGAKSTYMDIEIWQDFGTIKENCPSTGISNVKADFSCQGQVSVTYDLGTTNPTDVTLYYSPDNGKTWLTAQTVTGDLTAQSTGTGKTIVWDNRADNVKWGKFRLKVEVARREPELDCIMIDGVCWAKSNVAAPGTFANNPEDFGMLYQWNNTVGWSATDPRVSTDGSAWNNAWTGNGANTDIWEINNNVCPTGFRVPIADEWDRLRNVSSQWTILNGIEGREFGSGNKAIFLPAAGRRQINGSLYTHHWSGSPIGAYWSSDEKWWSTGYSGRGTTTMSFDNNFIGDGSCSDTQALSIRCVKK
ncbi:MAG: leucine-rich repeat protein [Prevotellaceae bacterium]|jgi:uncharacterized protein (TIGR02145 family)|nr:leucine-rich repeat protein [Prevotellaceae bacterium]